VAQAAFPRPSRFTQMRDRPGTIYDEAAFGALYPRHSCSDYYRPTRSMARWPTTCQNPDLPFCSVGGLNGDFDEFGNGIRYYGNHR
jgi:hypothetical protein